MFTVLSAILRNIDAIIKIVFEIIQSYHVEGPPQAWIGKLPRNVLVYIYGWKFSYTVKMEGWKSELK